MNADNFADGSSMTMQTLKNEELSAGQQTTKGRFKPTWQPLLLNIRTSHTNGIMVHFPQIYPVRYFVLNRPVWGYSRVKLGKWDTRVSGTLM